MSTTSNNLKSSATSLANAPRNNVATAIERELSSTMLMSNGTAKLSSLTPARDLSLGGRGGGGAANKKIFLPNLNVTRNKNKNVKTSKDTTISKSRGRGRTLDRSANGTSSGGRLGSSSLIQMTGVFSEGAGAANVRQPFGTSAYSKEIDDAPSVMRKPTLLKSEKKIDIKAVLAKDIDILKSLDDIDDHDDLEQKTDLDRMPVHLNEIKWKYTKTKVKSESMEYKADCGNSSEDAVEIASQIQALHVAQQSEQNNPIPRYPQTLKELFDKTQPQIFVMQLPDTLPCLKGDSDSQETSVSPATLTTDKLNNVTHKMKMVKDNEVKQMEEGHVGRLIRYKSGKTKLVLGKTYFDLDIGMETGFLQDLMSISCNRDERSGNMINLGPIRAKLTATPDWEQLLKQPLQRCQQF